ncbi:hypothetical protein GW950_01500 [Candidatus Wolfebacteria bacterium]|nr:hypothetical protein [Candidatus Wolfebacteria bacterium]
MSNNLYEKKWNILLKRSWPFKFIPFIDFVFVAGSMAMGGVKDDSDFDVIIGARWGRIFLVRFLCYLTFNLLGLRAKHIDNAPEEEYKNKFCFNHFITVNSYKLSPPYNNYWKNLYKSLVPIFGKPEEIQKFYDANAQWMGERRIYKEDKRHLYKEKTTAQKFREQILSGVFGEMAENFTKKIQLERIKKNLKKTGKYKPRIIYNDDELEFHPHTKRIEDFITNQSK